jgi:siroheme synthase (precorrin-2 oxidase/ferrochelatase)
LSTKEREKLIPPIEVKSKFCSGFLSFRIVDIIEVRKETLEKHTIKFRTTKKVHLSTTVNNKYILFRKCGSKTCMQYMVDERKAQHISEICGKRFIFVLLPTKISLKKIQRSMVTNSSQLLLLVYANGNFPYSSFFVRAYIFNSIFSYLC